MKRRRLFRMERGPCRPWNGAKSGSRLIRRIGNAYPMGKWSRFRQRPASQAGADAVDGLADVLDAVGVGEADIAFARSEEHTSELQSLMRISYAVFCLKKTTKKTHVI